MTHNSTSKRPDPRSIDTIASTLPLTPGTWTLDHAHSTVGFAIRHLGISKVRGTFAGFDAELRVGVDLDQTTVSATVDLASIDTGNADRDAHVRSSDLLDVERRPTMHFASTEIRGARDTWILDGLLTIGEVSRPIVFDVTFGGADRFPIDDRVHAGFSARGQLRRREFGLTFGLADPVLGDVVEVAIDLQLVAPE
jgi:polyisoprenoid-binding protein YceI